MPKSPRILYICGGLQSSGSTLLSWCFLQRHDMNGYLDAPNDLLEEISPDIDSPFVWYKTTICCFRVTDILAHYRDMGWQVRPLLVVRDVRRVWDSLIRKPYGRNGTTAEDPPLRVRLRRFKEDWEQFRKARWPMLRFETFLADPERALEDACASLGLPWDPGMTTWPKSLEQIADTKRGNETFRHSRRDSLQATMRPESKSLSQTLAGDLKWLEAEFEEFNSCNDYPINLTSRIAHLRRTQQSVPRYSVTRKCERTTRRRPVPWLRRRLQHMRRKLAGALAAVSSMLAVQ